MCDYVLLKSINYIMYQSLLRYLLNEFFIVNDGMSIHGSDVEFSIIHFQILQTIDAEEMEKMLDSSSGMMFTKAEVKDMFKRIDLDNTNSIDFMELLSVS